MIFQIIIGDSKYIYLKDNIINLTITSPYYRNAIDYNKHLKGNYYRGKKDSNHMSIEEYIDEMILHFTEIYRITKDGGYCIIVIGNELDSGKIVTLPGHFSILMDKIGWILQEEIIWYKVTGGKKRFRVTIQHPYSTYYYSNILHEKILVFRKNEIIHRRDNLFMLNDLMKKEVANSVWHIAPVPPNFHDHPCPFPEDLVYRLIKLYSSPNDLVLDPFNGIGTTTKVAYHLNRNTIGYDIIGKYCEIAKKRKNDKLNLRKPLYPIWKKSEENI